MSPSFFTLHTLKIIKMSKHLTAIKITILIGAAAILFSVLLSSCGTRNGYGCKGNQSWDKMVRRNNRP
jgi:hypothetical protein